MVIIKTQEDRFADLYIKAIKRVAKNKGIEVKVLEPKNEDSFRMALKAPEWKLVLEPCKYPIEQFERNLEGNNTAIAILEYCNEIQSNVEGVNNVLLINRSELIGRPLIDMLLDNDYTVTVAHSKTNKEDIQRYSEIADIIILATGHDMTEYDFSGKIVIDASGDYKERGHEANIYITMRMIGDLTIDVMLSKIKDGE